MILGIRYFHQLPTEGRMLICTCADTVFGPYPILNWKPRTHAICTVCRKQRIHNLHMCGVCDSYFVKNFRHPGFCWRDPICFDCLSPNSFCNHCHEHNPHPLVFSYTIIPPPPKKERPPVDEARKFRIIKV